MLAILFFSDSLNHKMAIQLAVIDFGTTYSGYAFSVTELGCTLTDVEILANQLWVNSESNEIASLKTPTCLLLNKNKEIAAFGYDAEEQYTDIQLDGETDNYYFFHRFKIRLFLEKVIYIIYQWFYTYHAYDACSIILIRWH